MKVIALRGVCIGPERYLVAGETADLDPATVQFLVSIRAVDHFVEAAEVVTKDDAADLKQLEADLEELARQEAEAKNKLKEGV